MPSCADYHASFWRDRRRNRVEVTRRREQGSLCCGMAGQTTRTSRSGKEGRKGQNVRCVEGGEARVHQVHRAVGHEAELRGTRALLG
jgi:hypothetical protein